MKKNFFVFLLGIFFILSACDRMTKVQQSSQPNTDIKNTNSYDYNKELIVEHRIDPPLSDSSSSYVTEEFKGIEGDNWYPIRFLDNDNFLYTIPISTEETNWIYKHNIKSKKTEKMCTLDSYQDMYDIQSASNFSISDSNPTVSKENNQVNKKISLKDWKQKHPKYESYDIVQNSTTEKLLLINYKEKSLVTDYDLKKIEELPFSGVYRAAWIDNSNLILGAYDNISAYEGSAVITYNIENKTSKKTYIGDNKAFLGPYRASKDFCGFFDMNDYHGPATGTLGVVDYSKNKIIFLELKNIAEFLNLQYNWVIAPSAENPINWEVWGGTTDGMVRLCLYDVATNNYIIRAKAIPRPNGGMIISPDGKTIIYQSMDKNYINYEK